MSTPDDMLREAERAKDANPCPETWQALAAVRERVGWKSPNEIKRERLRELCDSLEHVTKEIAVLAGEVGGTFWTGSHLNGTVQEWRVNGKCRTWVTEPEKFNLPVKQGWNTFGGITHYNCTDFMTQRPTPPVEITIRRVYLDRYGYVKDSVLGIERGTYFGTGMKVWAYTSSYIHSALHDPSPPDLAGVVSGPNHNGTHTMRAPDRDAIRIHLRNFYREKGLAVNFTR